MTHTSKPYKIEIIFFDGFYGNKKIVLDDLISLELTKHATESSEWNLKIKKIPNISVLDKIEIRTIYKDFEEKIFIGFISEIFADLEFLELTIVDFKNILERKIVLNEQKNSSAKNFLEKILDEWRRMTGENIVLEIDGDISGNFEATAGDSFYGVVQNIADDNYMFDYDISARKIFLKKILGKKRSWLYTYSLYHRDSRMLEVGATISEKIATRYYLTENRNLQNIATSDEAKYGVLVSTSDNDKKDGFWIDRNFEIRIDHYCLSVWDVITLEIIGRKYSEEIINSWWSTSQNGTIAGDYISYYGEAYVLSENIIIDNGIISKQVEIGTKIKRKRTLTEILLTRIR